ncbi:hypothetical protein FB45DRAFT_894727 [Roridomyces roridus]|uniref:F-box domain-containing protein n=1 Tax=Roridomyces roridus TaxID=1738132 RepID=A0AAD7FZQ0_9AGAR|nr:hypothetical protein FB45DRAFT_894727 [Roridomyces roridus]
MHPCLEIPELVENIVSQLGQDPEKNLGSLAALARTARVLQDAALDALWRTQSSVLNVLRCMPSDLFEDVLVDGVLTSLTPRRIILASDWNKIYSYAARVKTFIAHPKDGLSGTHIFQILSLSLPNDYIYPNLTDLYWTDREDGLPLIRPLLGPKITQITVRCSAPLHLSLLSLLPERCPSLEDLTIDFPDRETMAGWTSNAHSLFDFVQELCCITRVQMDIMDMVALKHIGRLPRLEVLHAEGLPDDLLTSRTAQKSLFPSLRHLHSKDSSIASVTRLVTLCSATLESLTVDCESYAPPKSIKRLLAALESHHSSLTDLEIKCSNDGADGSHANGSLTQMAQAWPHLQGLVITGLESTVAFHCPNLERLEMEVDTTDIAHFISAVFPNLRSVKTAFDAKPSAANEASEEEQTKLKYRRGWKEVRMYLPVLAKVRAEERRWAQMAMVESPSPVTEPGVV